MDAQDKDEGRIHGLTASVVIPKEGDGSGVAVTISASTAALALAVVGVVVSVVMLTWGFPHLQGAELALVEDEGGRLAAAA